jgi:hypothetical protein
MLRKFACAVLALAIAVGVMVAAEVKGKLKEVTADKLVITVKDKDETYTINDDTKIVSSKGKAVKDREKAVGQLKKMADRGAEVTIQTEEKDGKKIVTEIKMPEGKKKGG